MSDLTKALRKAVEFKTKRLGANSTYAEDERERGREDENVRLQPLWDKVIAVVEAAQYDGCRCTYRMVCEGASWLRKQVVDIECRSCKALEQLRLAVGEK